jgi:hypothetical protein
LDFVKVVEKRLLHYSDIEIHYRKSGAVFNFIFRLFGWKTARFFQHYYYRIRYT